MSLRITTVSENSVSMGMDLKQNTALDIILKRTDSRMVFDTGKAWFLKIT